MHGPSLPLSSPLSSLPYLRSSKQEQKGFARFFQGTKEETDGREVQTFCYPLASCWQAFHGLHCHGHEHWRIPQTRVTPSLGPPQPQSLR